MLNGERLKNERILQNLTQEDMANKLGITRQAYGNYEAGKRDVDSQTLVKLSSILNISVDYLLGLSNLKKSIKVVNDFDGNSLTEEEKQLLGIIIEGWRNIKNNK